MIRTGTALAAVVLCGLLIILADRLYPGDRMVAQTATAPARPLNAYDQVICTRCNGYGKVPYEQFTGSSVVSFDMPCPACHGRGWRLYGEVMYQQYPRYGPAYR